LELFRSLVIVLARAFLVLRTLLERRVLFLEMRTLCLDHELFLSLNTRAGKGSRTLSIFPFDARRTIEIDFSLYSRLSSFRDSVTPVRRREDTEGDGNAGVKVQIAGLEDFPRMPFELS
jgi:hypothetical protein